MAAQVALKRDTEEDHSVLTLPSHCLPMFSRSPPNRFGVTTGEESISPHSDEGKLVVVHCISFLMCKHSKTVCMHNNLTFTKTYIVLQSGRL